MTTALGQAIEAFAKALDAFRAAIGAHPALADQLFLGTEEWVRLLHYKLLPHLGGEGCLVVAVAGGTNTGKSTVFNLLLGRSVSAVCATAAATCRPVIAANAHRARQCLDGHLLSGFRPALLPNPDAPVSHESDPSTLFVSQQDELPERLAIMDIPDVDSIDRENWELANNIQAAGDVLIAVVTPEKYKDERVVAFFQRAHAAGRRILPLLNKANPDRDYAAARTQLDDFRRSAGLGRGPAFVIPHDFRLADNFARDIAPLDGTAPLAAYLKTLDAAAIKADVYRDTIAHFTAHAGAFLEGLDETSQQLRAVAADFTARVEHSASLYDPEPGEDVGRLVHAFVQSKRGPVRRAVGRVNDTVGQGVVALWRRAGGMMRGRAEADAAAGEHTESDVAETLRRRVETLARNLAEEYVRAAPTMGEPARTLLAAGATAMDIEAAVRTVLDETTRPVALSGDFQAHARKTMEVWWNDHTFGRRVLIELDTILVGFPLAAAVALGMFTGGFGAAEVATASGTIASTFFSKVMEHQFADHWMRFVQPWRDEQRMRFQRALQTHLADAFLAEIHAAIAVLEGDAVTTMRRAHEQCRKEF